MKPFLEMAQISSEAQVRGQPLERWPGRPGIDMGALAATLKRHGFTRNFPTVLRGARHDEDVEVSALTLPGSPPHHQHHIAFGARRRASSSKVARELPQSVEQMNLSAVPAEGHGARSDRLDRETDRGGADRDRRQQGLGRRHARLQPAEPLHEDAPLWPRDSETWMTNPERRPWRP